MWLSGVEGVSMRKRRTRPLDERVVRWRTMRRIGN
ncbi:hypothetical protein CVT25_002803 [Psilocybe cyanescens]|uniref:Uncharacterized protein n=1 Tax=Psilocybe cyanescens TaxID=93625 RepID=A0A409WL82_PSICY|nr:hypothetical protein CVT25_002803 [Psilocybe cyanescens]